MLKRIAPAVFLTLLCTYTLAAQIDAPTLTPVPSTESQQRLIAEGIALHDQKNYDGAIHKYEEVLKENPDNVTALYEMAFSYSEKEDYKKSLEVGYRGAQYKSELLPRFYMMVGNSLDNLGDAKKAVDVYKAGIKIHPNFWLLHFNLAITYNRMGKVEDARKSVKKSAALNPDHTSSHFLLGDIFYKGGYKTPALLAMSRFLVLEPNSQRSDHAYQIFQEVLRGGVSAGKNPNEITISVDTSAKKDEGDFGTVDLMIGLTKAGDSLEKNKGKTKTQLAVEQLETYFAMLAEQDSRENRSKFVWRYYIPYFLEMKKRNYIEPFYYYISRRSSDQEVQKWFEGNFRRVNEFLNWSKQYQWPRIDD